MQEWNQNDTYNLYLSDTRGVYFTLAMENVKTTRGIGGNQMLDLYEVGAWSKDAFVLLLHLLQSIACYLSSLKKKKVPLILWDCKIQWN